MEKHMKECAKVFLRDQKKLFDEPVVYDLEEAEDFLEECFAQYCSNIKELRQIMDDEGMDVSELSDAELEEQLEVFKLDNNGGAFVVAAELGCYEPHTMLCRQSKGKVLLSGNR